MAVPLAESQCPACGIAAAQQSEAWVLACQQPAPLVWQTQTGALYQRTSDEKHSASQQGYIESWSCTCCRHEHMTFVAERHIVSSAD